jgi:hypothetical protein
MSKSLRPYFDMPVSDCGLVQDACTVDPVCTNEKLSTTSGTREDNDGLVVGESVADAVGDKVKDSVGGAVGNIVGKAVGGAVGEAVSNMVGDSVRDTIGNLVGDAVGKTVGECTVDGDAVGR